MPSLKSGRTSRTGSRIASHRSDSLKNQDFVVFAGIGENPSGGRSTIESSLAISRVSAYSFAGRNEKGKSIPPIGVWAGVAPRGEPQSLVKLRVRAPGSEVFPKFGQTLALGRGFSRHFKSSGCPAQQRARDRAPPTGADARPSTSAARSPDGRARNILHRPQSAEI
jgi:hypothetical protein